MYCRSTTFLLLLLCNTAKSFLESTNGSIQAPKLPVAFSTALQATLSLNALDTVVFDKVITNIGSGYNLNRGQFTAPVKGLYFISVTLFNFYHVSPTLEIVQNGNPLVDMYLDGSGHQNSAMTQTLVLLLNTGDNVWIRSKTDGAKLSGLSGQPNGVFNTFSGYCLQYME